MIDLIRDGAAPASMMRRAAQGALSLPAGEAIEILVVLASHRDFGAEAEQTLESWDEPAIIEVASNPTTPAEVLHHLLQHQLLQHQAQRPALVTALCNNPALVLAELDPAASRAEAHILRAMLASERVRNSSRLLELIASNSAAAPVVPQLRQWQSTALDNEAETTADTFIAHHAEEVAHDDLQPFELVTGAEDEEDPLAGLLTRMKQGQAAPAAPAERKQLSLLQRIGSLRVGDRIKLAVRGNREERMVLIRDRSKLVSLAVLESPKVNDAEMETFAAMKNVQESVLRAISTKRNYIKNYGVLRSLVNNPKTPLDVALPLLAHMLVKDLRSLAVNKNVNETVRKLAVRMFRTKTERKKKDD
jgi:hypothetical protein